MYIICIYMGIYGGPNPFLKGSLGYKFATSTNGKGYVSDMKGYIYIYTQVLALHKKGGRVFSFFFLGGGVIQFYVRYM